MADDSTVRITIALRAAHVAKQALEMLSMSPELCRLQIGELAKGVRELHEYIKENTK